MEREEEMEEEEEVCRRRRDGISHPTEGFNNNKVKKNQNTFSRKHASILSKTATKKTF